MWSLLFCGAAFVALICAAFIYASSENSHSEKALSESNAAMSKADQVEKNVKKDLDAVNEALKGDIETLKKTLDIIISKNEELDKLKNRIEWLEMKANNRPSSNKMVLSQEKPLMLKIIYKKSDESLVKTTKPELLKKIKKQMSELSQ